MSAPATIDNSTVLVTGATGFIGSHLVDYLLSRGCTVHCPVRKTSGLQWLDPSRVRLHTADLTQPGGLGDCFEHTEYVFHLAGVTKAKSEEEYYRINADACASLYKSCAADGKRLKAVVHISSLSAVGPGTPERPVDENTPCKPLTFYGKSKLAGEKIAEQFSSSLPIVILRPPVVYGPRERDFFTYLKMVHGGWNLKIGWTRRSLSLIYVRDLVRAMVQAAICPAREDKFFFITDGAIYSWEDVAQTAMRILDVHTRSFTIPEMALTSIALFSEALACFSSKPPLLDRQKLIEIRQSAWTASSEKFFNQYEFQPQYDLNKGLAETLDWYKKHHWF